MSDFKVGDRVYYFFHADDCSLIWNLNNMGIDEDKVTSIRPSGIPAFGDGYEFNCNDAIFKSKQEAIQAMRKRLDELQNE